MNPNGLTKSRLAMLAIGLIAVVVLVGLSISAIRSDPDPAGGPTVSREATGFPVTVATADGPITIPAMPRRVVSQTVMTDEVLMEILPPERLIGIHPFTLDVRYSNVVAEATSRGLEAKVIQRAEEIIAAEPDVVFMATYSQPEVVSQVRSLSTAAVVRLGEFNRLADLRDNILKIGQVVGEVEAAGKLVDAMDRRIAEAVAAIPNDAGKPRVMSYNLAGHTAGSGTLFDDIVTRIGAINVAAEQGVTWFGQVAAASVAAWNPDVIITGAPPGQEEDLRRQMLADPVLSATQAARSGKIVVLPDPLYLAVSHHVADLVAVLAEQIHDVDLSRPESAEAP